MVLQKEIMINPFPASHTAQHCRAKNGTECSLCALVCPVEKNSNSLKDVQCLKCGLCAAACPIRAIPAGMDNNAALRWAKELGGKSLHLLCVNAYAQENTTPILRLSSCVSALFAEIFIALYAVGIKRLILELGQCETCPYSLAKKNNCLEDIKTIFPNWLVIRNNCMGIKRNTLQITSIAAYPVTRRKFFNFLSTSPKQIIPTISPSASCLAQNIADLGVIPRHLALHSLRMLVDAQYISTSLAMPHNLLPAYKLIIDAKCNACGICAKVCPSQALTIQKTSNTLSLHHNTGKCLGCGLCVRMCKMHSLHISQVESLVATLLAKTNIIFMSNVHFCERCKASFIGLEKYCPACLKREQLF